MSGPQGQPERVTTRIVVALCSGLAIVSAMQIWVARVAEGEPPTVGSVALIGVVSWLPWALTAPFILAVGRRHDFGHGRRLRSLLVHIPVFFLCYVPFTAGLMFLGSALYGEGQALTRAELLSQTFAGTRLQLGAIVYTAILGLGAAVRTWYALRARELQASRLEAQATRARLAALSARLHPHFLFNTLHAIGALVDEDPPRARTMLALLGDLLRDVIEEADEDEIPLQTELDLLGRYLAIEQVRFADRLQVDISPDPGTLALPVPRLLLQPLAENALRHGLAHRAAGGRIWVRSWRTPDSLMLEVANDGRAMATPLREGIGLATTRERLGTRPGGGSLAIEEKDGRVVVRARLGLREDAGA